MPKVYAEVGSITTATRLKQELMNLKIKSEIIHTPKSQSGCSYSVRIDGKYESVLKNYTKRYNIKRIIKSDSD